ncbi:MAG: HAMP domain-containing histidine kinase [Defluviitaleaceae bacterium]|nr:HAMP domain-containing histidine kinase [Defluviitaleaceae bacterium]
MEDFSVALAHEIKNPAAVALAHVNMLRLGCGQTVPAIDGEDGDLAHHLNHIETALTNICDLVREMLAASQKRSELYEVDLGKILSDILETYRAAWPDILFSYDDRELLCLGHETSLRIIFSNLIKNAVEALEGKEGGQIEIFALADGDFADFLEVTVRDNGNTDASREKPHGNGLGLAICRNLSNGIGAHFNATPLETGGLAVSIKLRTGCPSFA